MSTSWWQWSHSQIVGEKARANACGTGSDGGVGNGAEAIGGRIGGSWTDDGAASGLGVRT